MIDLHTHTYFSDGALGPAELIQRANDFGYCAIAITDHADASNLEWMIERVRLACQEANKYLPIKALFGVELTHNPPEITSELVMRAWKAGAQIVSVHGESLWEPVLPGTNAAAVRSEIDFLAHPGLISLDDAREAAKRNIYLEISARKGHCLTNGYVANIGKQVGAKLILNTDSHDHRDFVNDDLARRILLGAGISEVDIPNIFQNSREVVKRFFPDF
jgi:histidinol phosphatase-like PHP family hydrolase